MTMRKFVPLTLAAGAMLMASFTAAPARADDGRLFGFIAGATALAIIADAAHAHDRGRVVVVERYREPEHRWGWRRDRRWAWRHDDGWHRHWED
ncbi:MAG: hypothetical protein KGI94_14960 [Paracoccaceae bacterium]|nr:hypothetical protein [Paracoccaceae bacterium]MDE3122013.1 hypothetical protein [Paracoccaceae bacterium]MDE3237920.1 hypothetical protein [Paracoccaceae bacterium]